MSTMRSGREIRTIVQEARAFSNTSKSNTYDLIAEADENEFNMRTDQLKKSGTMPSTSGSSNGETVESLQKKLQQTKMELDDIKMKFGALKRNYESVSHHSAKDSIENVRL